MKIQIVRECSDFLKASDGIPLVRQLPVEGPTERRVKIRKKRSVTPFDEAFNSVFSEHPDVRQRCVYANGDHTQPLFDPTMEPFYIFPKNGFKYMYSTSVTDSARQYGATYDALNQVMDSPASVYQTIGEILLFDYRTYDLRVALESGCEIIIFGCSSYYAIARRAVKSYSTLFSL